MSILSDVKTPSKAPPASASSPIHFKLNGTDVQTPRLNERSLLHTLREDFGICSVKDGCEPQASCGCCTLLVDGKPRLSCTLKTSQVEGKAVTTLEGVSEDTRKKLADSFVSCGGVQCGFCIPGMAMRGVSIVNENKCPTR